MYPHPDSFGYNTYEKFPEIFQDENIDFKYFIYALQMVSPERPNDFFFAGGFLGGSLKNKDISMLFSAVQRLESSKHIDFRTFLMKQARLQALAQAVDPDQIKHLLGRYAQEYNAKYGMRPQIHNFYLSYLVEEDRSSFIGSIAAPGDYYSEPPKNQDDTIRRHLLVVHDRPWWKVRRQKVPLAAGAVHVEDGVQYMTHRIDPSWLSAAELEQRRKQLPLGVGEVGRIRMLFKSSWMFLFWHTKNGSLRSHSTTGTEGC